MFIDIYSGSKNEIEKVLSNLYTHYFVFDGIPYKCVESFIQSLKFVEYEDTKKFIGLLGGASYRLGQTNNKWKKDLTLYYKGQPIHRMSDAYNALIFNMYCSVVEQCPKFRQALVDSYPREIRHSMGNDDPTQTILTEKEFCEILTELREILIGDEE